MLQILTLIVFKRIFKILISIQLPNIELLFYPQPNKHCQVVYLKTLISTSSRWTPPPLVREVWVWMRGWYKDTADRTPPPSQQVYPRRT